MITIAEENYIKAIYHLTYELEITDYVGTNNIASYLKVKPATASDMLKKLKDKSLINYEKYGKSSLTSDGKKLALEIIRKHRLWETFLCEKLGFSWEEVHEIAEQLEHIKSNKLIDRLDEFLNYPKTDPHGELIPNSEGLIFYKNKNSILDIKLGIKYKIIAVREDSYDFLILINNLGLSINKEIELNQINIYDNSFQIKIENQIINISSNIADKILIEQI